MLNNYNHLKLWLACLFTLSATLASAQFTTLAIQDFDTIGTPALGYSLTTGTPIRYRKGLTGSTTQIPNSPYGMNNSWAWYSESEDLTVTFDNVNIAGYDTAYISFKLAALFDVDAGDYVTVSISVNGGTTWYDRVRINGNGSNCSWAYAATGVVDHLFAPVNTTTTYMPPATGVSAVGPSTILIRVPNTTNQVRVKIRQRESAAEGYYLDDLAIKVRGTTMNNAAVTGLVSPIDFCEGSHDVKVKIANKGQNRINNVTVNWTLNGNPQSPVYYFNTLDTIGGTGKNMDTITLSNLFLASGTTSTIKVWTSDPNSVPDGFPSDDTMTFILRPALNGTYSIGGTTPNYTTIAAAVADLNLLGVCGPVTFNVAPGTYTGQLNLNYIKGASVVNTVEFIGALATTTIISSLTNNGTTLTLTDSRYVTFRDFTIQNTTSSNGTAVAFVGSTNKCAVKKCVINFPNYSGSTTYGIAVTGTASGYGITNNYGDSIQIDSNTINNSYYGIYLYGNSTSPSGNFNRSHKIRNNTITAYGYGINAAYVYNALTITGNTIQFPSGASQSSYGISASSCVNSNAANAHEVSGNVIKNAGQYGIYLSTVTNPAANPGRIFNNMVGGTFRNASANAMYITESGSSPSLIYHNSLNLDYAQSLNSNATIYYSGSVSTKIKNNIFAYTASGGAGVPAYIVTNLVSGNINNNVYYNAVTPTLIFKGSTGYTNANFRLATAGGDSSYNKVPTYTSASDLHVADACVRGTNLLALIGTDIDGDPRSSYPVIGADEMSAQPDNISVDAITAPQASFAAGLNDITVLVRNNGSTPLGSFAVTYVLNNGTPVTQFWNGFLNTCDTVSVVFFGANQGNFTANNSLVVYTSLPNGTNDSYPRNDTMKMNFTAPLKGVYIIGPAPSDFASFNAAVAALRSGGVSGHVFFDVKTGIYNEQLSFYEKVRGASDTSTITFRSMALHRDSVVLTYASASLPVINLANVNHIAFKDMTLEATDPDFGRVIELAGTTSSINIEGCKIKGITSGNYENVYGTYLSGKSLVFKNNLITDGYYGLYLYGDDNSTASLDSIMIEGNTFQNTSGYMGADIYYTKNLKVRNNTFTGNMDYALSTYYVYDAMEVTRNVINITGSYGLYMYYNNGTSTAGAMIANNSIRVTGDYGIRNYYGSYQKFYNNSISVTGRYPIYVSYNSTSYINNEWRNNIFHTSGITATSYAAYIANNTSATNTWNYNLYYTASTTAFIYYTQAYTTFAAYRTAQPTQDVNSFNAMPAFTGTTNLAPAVANVNSWYMNGRGIQTINDKDINGNARSTTLAGGTPDIGAYEFTPAVIPPVATASPASPAAGTTQVFTLLNDTVATITWNVGAAVPATLSVLFYSGEYAPATNSSHLRTNCYWDIQETGGGVYNYNANLYYKDPMKGSIPVEADMRLAKMHNSNPWTLYTGTQSSADVSRNILSAPGLTDFSAFTGTDNTNPLPVKLISLKGIKINDDALITWTTAGETNNKGFEVQRSLDGKQFETIGFVKGNGNTNAVSNYSYTDIDVPASSGETGNLYYRLNQLDNNGTSSLSTVVIINNTSAHPAPRFVLYPNPFSSQVFLNIPSAEATGSLIEVYDLSGKRMISLSKVLVQGENNIDLEQAASLKSGVYFVNVTVNGNREVMKLIKY